FTIIGKVADEEPDVIRSQMENEISFYDRAGNKTFFGTAAAPGPIYQLADEANTIWLDAGLITDSAKVDTLIDPSFVND
ncbi:hypothetical protein, partial [Brooklawnia sp.]|uniref:hypothetical protein n=1 Tax=Brooklawnia sp. TaxID=2699740 RepID=UPI0031202351